MPTTEEINEALWNEARAYHKAKIYKTALEAWQSAFRCWFIQQLKINFNQTITIK